MSLRLSKHARITAVILFSLFGTACSVTAMSQRDTVTKLLDESRDATPFDLYTQYRSMDGGLTLVIDEIEGHRLKLSCTTLSGGSPWDLRCDGVLGPGNKLYIVHTRRAPKDEGALVLRYQAIHKAKSLRLVGYGDYDPATGAWRSIPPNSINVTRGTFSAVERATQLIAEVDDLVRGKLTRSDAAPARPASPASSPTQQERSLEERLTALKALRDKGLIDAEEYKTKKQELLKDF